MAAPHVAGVVSLMLSANPALTPAQVLQQLKASAKPFPTARGAIADGDLRCRHRRRRRGARRRPRRSPRPDRPGQLRAGVERRAGDRVEHLQRELPAQRRHRRRPARPATGGPAAAGTTRRRAPGLTWLQVDFGAVRTVAEIDVFTVQDAYANPQEPTETMTFTRTASLRLRGPVLDRFGLGDGAGRQRDRQQQGLAQVHVPRRLDPPRRVLIVGSHRRLQPAHRARGVRDRRCTGACAGRGQRRVAGEWRSGQRVEHSTRGYLASAAQQRRPARHATGQPAGAGTTRTESNWPDVVQINFSGVKSITEIDVFTRPGRVRNPQEPTETMTFSQYGLTDFDVQYWTGSAWATVPGGSIRANNKVWRKFTFPALSTSRDPRRHSGRPGGLQPPHRDRGLGDARRRRDDATSRAEANGGNATASSTYSGLPSLGGQQRRSARAQLGRRRGLERCH